MREHGHLDLVGGGAGALVFADDPFTLPIEPPVPFTLGVRVSNTGEGIARSLKIESAQPQIVENLQGLLINFKIIGSTVQGQPATPSLLIDFGDIVVHLFLPDARNYYGLESLWADVPRLEFTPTTHPEPEAGAEVRQPTLDGFGAFQPLAPEPAPEDADNE